MAVQEPAATRQVLLKRLGVLLWRLLPANPILVRVVHGGSRRVRHLWIRFGYLAFLLGVVGIAMIGVAGGGAGGSTLADMAKNASRMFMWASVTQLALMCFLAPVFTAGAITQERDAQTFNILIATPLSNAQIVLGSLMSRLYFVLMLLLAGLPIFLITMIYGGVTLAQIVQSFAIAACTAFLTGSLAICISMIRVGTRRTIFSFYLAIALYLLAVYGLGMWPATWIPEAPANVINRRVSWLAAFHPFLALDVALNRTAAPDSALLGGYSSPVRLFAAYPHRAYLLITLVLSAMLTGLAMFFVRKSKDDERTVWGSLVAKIFHKQEGERRRKPKHVWKNPVAWREATTRASAATRGFLQYVLIGGGLVAAGALMFEHIGGAAASWTRQALSVVILIETGLILVVATNTAATAITKERESNSMELLLTTPLTSKYIIWGKLRGLVWFTIPLIVVPTLSLLVFGIYGLTGTPGEALVPIEGALELGAMLVVYSAFVCVVGLRFSLHCKKTVQAVMTAVGVVVVGGLLLSYVGEQIVSSSKLFGAAVSPLIPFTAIDSLIHPGRLFDSPQEFKDNARAVRVAMAVGCGFAFLAYFLTTLGIYRGMVRNFDMIVRKQSAQ